MITYSKLEKEVKQAGDLPKKIKGTAAEICKIRRDKGKHYRETATRVQTQKAKYEALIVSLESLLPTIQNNKSVAELSRITNDLRTALKKYSESIDELATRFENALIRILSFGYKSQGKSLFTKLYTGITDDNIICVKAENTDADQTGATNVIRHKKNNTDNPNPIITVFFRTKDEVLKLVNDAINHFADLTGRSDIISPFASYTDFENFMSDNSQKNKVYQRIGEVTDSKKKALFRSAQNLVLSIFNPVSDFSETRDNNSYNGDPAKENPKNGKVILPQEMTHYNNMQDPTRQQFLSVDHILIEVDLGFDDMFENFEICDTKGLSEGAGGELIEDALVEDINRADAVFSIQKIAQGGSMGPFVDKITELSNEERAKCHIKHLEDRHFCIANVVNNIESKAVKDFEKSLNQSHLLYSLYAGTLVPGEFDGDEIDPLVFVKGVMLNMIRQIVETTKKLDLQKVADCRAEAQKVHRLVEELKSKLNSIEIQPGDSYENFLLENVEKLRREIIVELLKECDSQNIEIDNPDSNIHVESVDGNNWNMGASVVKPAYDDDDDDDDDDYDGDHNEVVVSKSKDTTASWEVDTSKYHTAPNEYAVIRNSKKCIFYALTNHELKSRDWESAKDWDAKAEIESAVDYVLDEALINEGESWSVNSQAVKWHGVTPPADVLYIGSSLDMLRDKFMSILSYNLRQFRMERNPDKKDVIAHIYDVIFRKLNLYDLFKGKLNPGFDGVMKCSIENEAIKSLCDIVRNLDLEDKQSFTWLPSSFKLIKTYFKYADDVDSTEIASSILNRNTAKIALVELLLDCRNSIAAEIELKDADGQTPVSLCLKQVIDLLKDVSVSKKLCPLYNIGNFDKDHLDRLEKWGLISPENRKEYDNGLRRDELNEVRKQWNKLEPISAVY